MHLHVSLQTLLQQQAQPSQQLDPTPWPDFSELSADPSYSPVPSLSPLGAKVNTIPSSLHAAKLSQSCQHLPPVAPTITFTASSKTDSPPRHYAVMATKFPVQIQENLHIEDIKAELTQSSYKEKMHKLLRWEEKAHIEILGKR